MVHLTTVSGPFILPTFLLSFGSTKIYELFQLSNNVAYGHLAYIASLGDVRETIKRFLQIFPAEIANTLVHLAIQALSVMSISTETRSDRSCVATYSRQFLLSVANVDTIKQPIRTPHDR
jgi:hypothetical protein